MRKHARDSFFVVGEGVLESDEDGRPSVRQPLSGEELRRFRFSRLGPKGRQLDEQTRTALAEAITATGDQLDSDVPAGFTYLGCSIVRWRAAGRRSCVRRPGARRWGRTATRSA